MGYMFLAKMLEQAWADFHADTAKSRAEAIAKSRNHLIQNHFDGDEIKFKAWQEKYEVELTVPPTTYSSSIKFNPTIRGYDEPLFYCALTNPQTKAECYIE